MDATSLKKFSTDCVSAFKTVRPDWQTPHKTIYKVAKKMGFVATVDGMTEADYNKEWDKLFEEGLLQGDRIRVILTKGGTKDKTKVVFRSDDLRHLKVVGK